MLLQAKGSFKDFDIDNSDLISNVAFNHNGSLLAVGDRGGRVVVLSRNQNKNKLHGDEYTLYSTFQSHEPDFDYLKSVEIEERINKINWLTKYQESDFLLTTNDKTIKLFRINDQCFAKDIGGSCVRQGFDPVLRSVTQRGPNGARLRREATLTSHPMREAKCLRVFSDAHHYNIHSISGCCDHQYFISADDLRINLWSLARNDTCFTIVDAKPERMDLLSEIITTATFHPTEPDIFLYTTSRGATKLCDSRINAICDVPALVFEDLGKSSLMPCFAEALFSISSFNFASNPRYFLTRNYLEVDIWDCNMNREPIETYNVQEFLSTRERLSDMYEQDYLFDKFDACFGSNDKIIVTGTYGDHFSVTSRANNYGNPSTLFYTADPKAFRLRTGQHVFEPLVIGDESIEMPSKIKVVRPEFVDYQQKITFLDCHPEENLVALAVNENLLLIDSSPSHR